ncbi:hypothetical protein [Salarchaeum japonicum]|uniref:Uncharacterized protein n=1 Tax=Salarchaeum japonicum TaxID=555573 RepID=A0AAV3T214_9EURY|nr:hypothetical protein [Salarchaeum japonicum]
MASVSASHVILFIAAVAVAAMLAGTATGVANDVSTAIRDTGQDYGETLDTDFAIISDPGSSAIYNASETTVTLLVKNTGENVLSTNPDRVDTLIDGQFVQETDITVLDGDYWRPGNVARITLNTTIDEGAHRVVVRSNERRSLLTFPFYGSAADLSGDVVFSGSVKLYDADTQAVTTYLNETVPEGLGPSQDFDEDGAADIPYVNQSGALKIAYGNGTNVTLPGQPFTSDSTNEGTRVAVGTWNGSDRSIFFGNNSGIYGVTLDSRDVFTVADQSNAQANGIIGITDFDGDSADELLFVTSNPGITFLDDDGTVHSSSQSLSSPLGVGTPGDFDDDGNVGVPYRDGSGYISILEFTSGSLTSYQPNGVQEQPETGTGMGAADIDDDDTPEIIYVEYASNAGDPAPIRYMQGPSGDIGYILTESGEQVIVDTDTTIGVA